MKIEFAEQDLIKEVETTPACQELFHKVLGMDVNNCWISDQSSLSDFTGCGMSLDLEGDWDTWVIRRIEEEFKVTLPSTHLTIIQIVNLIQQGASPAVLN